MRYILLLILFHCCVQSIWTQPSFLDNQRVYPRFTQAINNKQTSLRKKVMQVNLQWPVQQIYIRSFKYDGLLEVWGRNKATDTFTRIESYKICALSGTIGPKRIEGDYQVPEGFYYINEFNPKSEYHMSLGLNYPNASDLLLSDSLKPGSEIYIHGRCITVGCIPIQNDQIEELYILASMAHEKGQDFIPVHIFPVQFNQPKSVAYLMQTKSNDAGYLTFVNRLKKAFDYFEAQKKIPVIAINASGEYMVTPAFSR